MCPQKVGGIVGTEDCLIVNIWVRNESFFQSHPPSALRPVAVYIHGGDLTFGAGGMIGNRPWRFARDGNIVSVSINYRLNVLGFLALSALSAQEPRGVSGNLGLLDQLLALQWLQTNIAAFGGDPNQVTIWGQSSGGTSILALLSSPLLKGLAQGAIAMSASPRIDAPLAEAEAANLAGYISASPCANSSASDPALLRCLLSANFVDLVSTYPASWDTPNYFGIPYYGEPVSSLAIVDGYVVKQNVSLGFAAGDVLNIPLMLGTMHEEPDLSPVDLVLTYSPVQFDTFLTKKFAAWGPDFGAKVAQLYAPEHFLSSQQRYDSLIADLRMICGNIRLAKSAAASKPSPTYMYIATQLPQAIQCLTDPPYCPRYAYHTWDLLPMLLDIPSIPPLWDLLPQDIKWSDLVFSRFVEFMETGRVEAWAEVGSVPGNWSTVHFNAQNEANRINAKQQYCDFWYHNNFAPFWMQN